MCALSRASAHLQQIAKAPSHINPRKHLHETKRLGSAARNLSLQKLAAPVNGFHPACVNLSSLPDQCVCGITCEPMSAKTHVLLSSFRLQLLARVFQRPYQGSLHFGIPMSNHCPTSWLHRQTEVRWMSILNAKPNLLITLVTNTSLITLEDANALLTTFWV